MSFKEIGEVTGVSINTALGRMRYAVMNLRKMIEDRNLIFTQ
jgi:RNA polymerase sigma-70 factor (ECF subfamily)